MAYDEKLAERVRGALATRRDVVEKTMFGGVAFMIRGHMSCGIVGEKLMVRIDPDREGALLRERGARPMDFTGRRMRGFLFVDPPGIEGGPALRKWVGRAIDFAESRPKKAGRTPAPRHRAKTRRAIARVVLGLGLGAFLVACASAPPPAQVGVVRGTVFDTFGNALPGIVVSIRAADGRVFQSVTTGEGGAYEFPAVPVGEYEVFSEFSGYRTVSPIPVKVTPSGLAMPPRLVLQPPEDPDSSSPR